MCTGCKLLRRGKMFSRCRVQTGMTQSSTACYTVGTRTAYPGTRKHLLGIPWPRKCQDCRGSCTVHRSYFADCPLFQCNQMHSIAPVRKGCSLRNPAPRRQIRFRCIGCESTALLHMICTVCTARHPTTKNHCIPPCNILRDRSCIQCMF